MITHKGGKITRTRKLRIKYASSLHSDAAPPDNSRRGTSRIRIVLVLQATVEKAEELGVYAPFVRFLDFSRMLSGPHPIP